jgi:hypothetical protein
MAYLEMVMAYFNHRTVLFGTWLCKKRVLFLVSAKHDEVF